MSTEKDLNYWKENAEENYRQVPISVLRYITELETEVKNCSIHDVSNPLPTKEKVIAEGDKQIKDWLMDNSFEERTAYRIGFRRSFEYVLRFIK